MHPAESERDDNSTSYHESSSLVLRSAILTVTPSRSTFPLSLTCDPSSSEVSHTREIAKLEGESHRPETTIGKLPDNILIEIFDFYRKTNFYVVWEWHLLAHVCRRWRQLIFESPRRLNLQILCTDRKPVRKNLRIWPAFPIIIDCTSPWDSITTEGEDNIIAALEHPNRICHVTLSVSERVIARMQEPFPMLTHLVIYSHDGVIPGGFLGGSAPRLLEIETNISLPELSTLLLSTSNLVTLTLYNIPYKSPEAMLACLSALTRLKTLDIWFQEAAPYLDELRPPPVTQFVLPVLNHFQFSGSCEYLENLVARTDSPQLDWIYVKYSNQHFDAPVAQFAKFLDRSMGPKLTLPRCARVYFLGLLFSFTLYRETSPPRSNWALAQDIISCVGNYRQASNIAQSFRQFSAVLSDVVYLTLEVGTMEPCRRTEDADSAEWLHLLRQFSTVQFLYVSEEIAEHVASALEDVTAEMAAEVLPSLDLICLDGQPTSLVEQFVATRQLSGLPVTVVDAKTEFIKRLESSFSK